MRVNGQKGFTILETILVVAVSTALFASLVFGIQYMISRAKFSDTMTDLRTAIRSQYEEVISGINSRNSAQNANICGAGSATVAAGSSDCLVMGKVITFAPNSPDVKVNYITGTPVNMPFDGDDIAAIQAANPRLSTVGQDNLRIQWASTFAKSVRLSNGSTGTIAIAIVRSPVSSNVIVYSLSSVPTLSNLLATSSATPNVSTAFLIKNSNSAGATGGAICVNSGSSSSSINSIAPVDPSATFSGSSLIDLEKRCSQ